MSKNAKRTTDDVTGLPVLVSKVTLGTNDGPLTAAEQLKIFTGTSGCVATLPEIVVAAPTAPGRKLQQTATMHASACGRRCILTRQELLATQRGLRPPEGKRRYTSMESKGKARQF